MGGGHTGQEFQHRIDDKLREQLARDIDGPYPGVPEPNQREELPFLVVVCSGDQGHQGLVHR